MAMKQFENIDRAKIKETQREEIKEFTRSLPEEYQRVIGAIPQRYKRTWMLIYQQRLPRGQSVIKAKCLECSGWESLQVARCDCKLCPIWAHRPFQKKVDSEKDGAEE